VALGDERHRPADAPHEHGRDGALGAFAGGIEVREHDSAAGDQGGGDVVGDERFLRGIGTRLGGAALQGQRLGEREVPAAMRVQHFFQHACGGVTIGQGAVGGVDGDFETGGELLQPVAPAAELFAGDADGVEQRVLADLGRQRFTQPAAFPVEEADVKPHVMADEDGPLDQSLDGRPDVAERRLADEHVIADARHRRRPAANGPAGVEQLLIGLSDGAPFQADNADLDHAVAVTEAGAGGFYVDDAQGKVEESSRIHDKRRFAGRGSGRRGGIKIAG